MTNGDSERLGQASGLSRRLLALLVGLLAMVTLIASGAPSAAAQSRVGAQPQNLILTVGVQTVADPEVVGLHALPKPQQVSATGVAAETANEGIYVVRSEAGNDVGQSGNITQRLARHVSTGKFTQPEVDAAERFGVSGGRTAREIAEQLKIDSPEFGGIDDLLNKVNPIGTRRLDLMPDGYTR